MRYMRLIGGKIHIHAAPIYDMRTFEAPTPDAYPEIVEELLDQPVTPSRAGDTRELLNVSIVSENPRRRWMHRNNFNVAFALQESFAYWRGLNPGHVQRYNTNMQEWMVDGELPGSAYGDRLRNTAGHDQITRAIEQLKENPESRRAVMQVFQAAEEDFNGGDVSCTESLQVMLRDNELHMTAVLRSQDMFWGFPYDAQNNQFIQEQMAGILGVDVGTYTHVMKSCHFYTDFEDRIRDSLDEHVAYSSPDCRLHRNDIGEVYRLMDVALHHARHGRLDHSYIDQIRGVSPYHADWVLATAAYDLQRYFDRDRLALNAAEMIEEPAFWQQWIRQLVAQVD